MWPLDYLIFNQDNLTVGTISGVFGGIIILFLVSIWKPLGDVVNNLQKLFVLFIKNPYINMQVEIGANLDPLPKEDYVNSRCSMSHLSAIFSNSRTLPECPNQDY